MCVCFLQAVSLVQIFDVAFPTLSMLTTPLAIFLCGAFMSRPLVCLSNK